MSAGQEGDGPRTKPPTSQPQLGHKRKREEVLRPSEQRSVSFASSGGASGSVGFGVGGAGPPANVGGGVGVGTKPGVRRTDFDAEAIARRAHERTAPTHARIGFDGLSGSAVFSRKHLASSPAPSSSSSPSFTTANQRKFVAANVSMSSHRPHFTPPAATAPRLLTKDMPDTPQNMAKYAAMLKNFAPEALSPLTVAKKPSSAATANTSSSRPSTIQSRPAPMRPTIQKISRSTTATTTRDLESSLAAQRARQMQGLPQMQQRQSPHEVQRQSEALREARERQENVQREKAEAARRRHEAAMAAAGRMKQTVVVSREERERVAALKLYQQQMRQDEGELLQKVDEASATMWPEKGSRMRDLNAGPSISGKSSRANLETTEQLKSLLENVALTATVPPLEKRIATPEGLKIRLLEHQKIGVDWMVKMEKGTNKGGILADDMGLGKTVQSLACCILHRTPADPTASEATITLIVAPTSLLYQWADEIKYKVHEGLLRVRIYYGKHKRGTSVRELAESADVVLTTYTTLALEHAEKRRNPLFQMHWLRVILDEAHTIKNRDTLAAHACTDLMADYRWCLSGTPIQNKVSELYSLIRFLKIQPYCDWDKFRKDIEAPLKKNERSGIKRVQALLQSVCLRRTKNSTLDGRNIIVLPSKTVHVIEVDFSSAERAFYSNLEEQSIQKFNKYLADGAVMKNYSNVLVLLLRLRQACCHLSLTGLSQESNRDSPGIPTVSATVALELMDPAVLRRLRDLRLASLGVCPVCADAFEAGKVAIPCGCVACGECVALVGGDGRGEEGGCPGCHGEVCPGFVESGELAEGLDRDVDVGCASKLDDLDAGVSELEDLKADLGKSERLYHFMNAIEGIAGNVKVESNAESACQVKAEPSTLNLKNGSELVKIEVSEPYSRTKAEAKIPDVSQPSLPRLESSTKIYEMMKVLQSIRTNSPNDKTIVFTQFCGMMTLCEPHLAYSGFSFVRYDGSMSADQRSRAVQQLQEDPDTLVMLVSLKCGSLGLNLTCANHVIILDFWWNMAVENQAVDRVHRLGQMKEVSVHRITIRDTVEERILEMQRKKQELFNAALGEGGFEGLSASKLGLKELIRLFTRN